MLTDLVLGLLFLLVSVALHEVGHLLAGRIAGCRIHLFALGPIRLRWEGRSPRLSFNWADRVAGGFVVASPPMRRSVILPIAVLIAGGPGLNLLLASFALGLYQAVPKGGALRQPSLLFAIISLLTALIALNPFRRGLASDGLRLWRLWRGGPPAERDAALFTLTGLDHRGVRPARWPADLLARCLEPADASTDEAAARIMAYYAALDRGEPVTAAVHLERAIAVIEKQPRSVRAPYYLEAAFAAAFIHADADRAEAYLRQAEDALDIEPYVWLRCEAALLLSQAQPTAALERLDLALALLARKQERTGTDHLEARLLRDLHARGERAIRPRR